MRLRSVAALASALGAATLPSAARAQSAFHIGISGGIAVATEGEWNRGYSGGAHARLSMELDRVIGRLGLQADAEVYGFRRDASAGQISSRTTVPGVSANLVLPLTRGTARLRPYLLAGGGSYRTEYGEPQPDWHFGVSGGGGLRFGVGRTDLLLETRVLRIGDGSTPRLVPVLLGLRF